MFINAAWTRFGNAGGQNTGTAQTPAGQIKSVTSVKQLQSWSVSWSSLGDRMAAVSLVNPGCGGIKILLTVTVGRQQITQSSIFSTQPVASKPHTSLQPAFHNKKKYCSQFCHNEKQPCYRFKVEVFLIYQQLSLTQVTQVPFCIKVQNSLTG